MPENVPKVGRSAESQLGPKASKGNRKRQSSAKSASKHPMRAPQLATFVIPPSEISVSPSFFVKADSISISPSSSSSSSLRSPGESHSNIKQLDPPIDGKEPALKTPPRVAFVPNEDDLETPYDNPAIPRMRRSSCASLEHKARKILEREMMFEKLLSATRANLLDIEEQMNELGNRYMTVRRSTGSVPTRKRVEIPEMLPSPIRETSKVKEKENNDSFDEDFTRVLRSTPPLETTKKPHATAKPPVPHRLSTHERPLLSSRPLQQRN